ncbi:MAG: NapC/NirT family cytochrome c [Candidatus Poribacteria bacterium]
MSPRVKLWVKRFVKSGLIIVPVFVILLFGAIEYTSRPEFCKSCHFMEEYYNSWKNSKHGKEGISCLECHYPPGIEATVVSKMRSISQVVSYFTRTEGKPWAEIDDKSCLRPGCHNKQLIEGAERFTGKNPRVIVSFNHRSHLTQLRRGKQLRCVSCHSQIVQGEHITVTESTCFLCHFKDVPEETKTISDCLLCHGAPMETIEVAGIKFEHKSILERGVDCKKCHLNAVTGDGTVPRQRCWSCHMSQERLQYYDKMEPQQRSLFVHNHHITEHSIECYQCHLEIQHEDKDKNRKEPPSIECRGCHPDHHKAQIDLYAGGAENSTITDPMFKVHVNCEGCHIKHEDFGVKGVTKVAKPAACASCHGVEYHDLYDEWVAGANRLIKQLTPASELVASEISRIEKRGGNIDEAQKLYENASRNIDLIRYGEGVHNVRYSQKLLDEAYENLREAMKSLGSDKRVPPLQMPTVKGDGDCLKCHFGIEANIVAVHKATPLSPHTGVSAERNEQVEYENFPHGRHVIDGNLACSKCHIQAPKEEPDHGKNLPESLECLQCHHKEPNCQKCHREPMPYIVAYQQKSFNHDVHVSASENQCASCHAANTQQNFKEDCKSCHHDERQVKVEEKCESCHPIQTAMYDGGKYNIPSMKFDAKIDCVKCHKPQTAVHEIIAERSEQDIIRPTDESCNTPNCHKKEDNYAVIMDAWQSKTKQSIVQIEALEKRAEKLLQVMDVPEAAKLYQAAKDDIDFVRADGTLSVHNPQLTDVLIKRALEQFQQCLQLLR